ncbi:hypothetical protein FOYG_16970 [Fusarium oxysporum NRRL 32931]|uniref:ABC transporter domain-containing protein n=1 Tax=Fusarium oxysporum NRRL 32931 TaxID=660029 RepID=W9HG22_FUSOX|nr:hypothetical protein FOYG_16970 [Fusarium oxysporum NRRL 32931]
MSERQFLDAELAASAGWNHHGIEEPQSSDSADEQRSASRDAGVVSVEQAEAEFSRLQQHFTNTSRRESTARNRNEDKAVVDSSSSSSSGFDLEGVLRGNLTAGREVGIHDKHIGVFWENLTVRGVSATHNFVPTFPDVLLSFVNVLSPLLRLIGIRKKPSETTLLHEFNGVCKPGEMVLVLGRPGSGCTTFLKTITNQRAEYTGVTGDVRYGPWTAQQFNQYRGESVYNGEEDIHHPTLTVEQTLQFALETKMPAKRPGNITKAEFKENILTTLLKMFSIEHIRKTVVGNQFVRGVSGGERKRVSIAEMLITNASILAWDNSSRGLDASTALDFVKSLRIQTDIYRTATFVCLYQASENIYNLFDKVMVIDGGRQVYYGPTSQARAYFEGLGFASRPRQTTPDYITGCTDDFEREYATGRSALNAPSDPETLQEAFRKSDLQQALSSELAGYKTTLESETLKHREFESAVAQGKRGVKRSAYQVGFHLQVLALVKRQFALKLQDRFNLGMSWLRTILLGIVLGTLYYDLGKTSASSFSKSGLIFVSLLYIGFQSFTEMVTIMTGRSILAKHKAYAFHRPSALWIAQVIVDQAFAVTEILIFTIIIYFMSDLVRTAGAFFTFFLVMVCASIAMTLLFRVVGCLSPDFDYALKFAVIIITLLVTTSGYPIQYQDGHRWLRWIFWVNPLGLSFTAFMANEFSRINMTCTDDSLIPSGPGYNDIKHQACTLAGSQPGTPLINGRDYLAKGYSIFSGDLWRNWGIVVVLIALLLFLNVVLGELMRFSNKSGSARVYLPPSKEREVLNQKLALKREARLRDKSNEAGSTLQIQAEGVLTWENLTYTVPVDRGERRLLNEISGYVRPGELTALMGSSGAGKTTLLDVLACRKNIGVITGDILVDNRKPGKEFQRATSYAEQQDVHEPTQTVREAFRFSAYLRQPYHVPIEEKNDYVEEIIGLLEMEDIADCIIGSADAGLTVEQRKRVTIGVELAAKPELLLFLDEPTSGLDSQSAFNIVRFLRKLSAAGQAIICTIHQPNAALFENFDRLLLLARGGNTIYFGDIGKDACVLREYLARNGAEAPPKANIAEFMLEAIGDGHDWAKVWKDSLEFIHVKQTITRLREERSKAGQTQNSKDAKEYASPFRYQLQVVTARMMRTFWRSPNYLFTRLANHIAFGVIVGLAYLNLDDSPSALQRKVFVVFQCTVLPALLITQIEVMFDLKRSLFYRESLAKMYSSTVFTASAIAAEAWCSVLCAVSFWLPVYFMPGLQATPSRAGYQFLMVLIIEFFSVTLAQGLAALSPSAAVSSQYDPFIMTIFILFCGVTIPYSQMPKGWRVWLYELNPFTRVISGMVSTELHGAPITCKPSELSFFEAPQAMNCGEYMQAFFEGGGPGYLVDNTTNTCSYCDYRVGDEFYNSLSISFDTRWRDLGILIAFVGSNIIITFLAGRYLNFNKR